MGMRIAVATLDLGGRAPAGGRGDLGAGDRGPRWSRRPTGPPRYFSRAGQPFTRCCSTLRHVTSLATPATPRHRSSARSSSPSGMGSLLPFALAPVGGLLERHPKHRTSHATLLATILDVLAGSVTAPERRADGRCAQELSDAELRVVRYLPSNLKAHEIAAELFVSANTVRTHLRHIYAKLDAHSRSETVTRPRELGLLAPGVHQRWIPPGPPTASASESVDERLEEHDRGPQGEHRRRQGAAWMTLPSTRWQDRSYHQGDVTRLGGSKSCTDGESSRS